MGFPTKNDHFGVFWGYHHFRKRHMNLPKNSLSLSAYRHRNLQLRAVRKYVGDMARLASRLNLEL